MNASTSSSIAQPSPGPWTAFRHERDETDYTPARIVYTIEDANGTRIASAIKHDADARLMAIAPELLASATALLNLGASPRLKDWRAAADNLNGVIDSAGLP